MKKTSAYIGIIAFLIFNVIVFQFALKKSIDAVEIPIAKTEIVPRTKITEDMIEILEVPKASISENVYTDKQDIINKYNDIEAKIPKGSFFFKELLFEEEQLPDYPSLKLKEGQSVFALSSDLIKSSGNTLMPNQKIDLYVTIEKKKELPITDLFLQDVRILNIKDKKGNTINEKNTAIPYVINLAIRSEYMEYLKIASKIGTIDLYATTLQRDTEECTLNQESKILEELNDESD